MSKKIEINDDELIESYVNQGISGPELAEQHGCSKQTIYRKLKKMGIPISKKTDILEDELIELYVNKGLSTVTIAEQYGCNEKTVRTKLKEYGIPIRSKSEAAKTKSRQNKTKKTCLEKFGTEHFLQSPELKRKCLEKYGVEHPKQTHIKNFTIWNDPLLFKQYLESFEVKNGRKPKTQEVADFFNVGSSIVNIKVKELKFEDLVERTISAYQLRVEDWLKQHNIQFTNEFYLEGKYYDIKVGDTLIEANPNNTHHINLKSKFNSVKGNIDYHMEKTKAATDNGYTCINMFQWNLEDIDNVLRFLTQENYNRIVHPIRPHIIIDLDIENPSWYPEYEPMTWYEHIKYVDMKTRWSNEYEEGLYPLYGSGYLKMKLKKPVE